MIRQYQSLQLQRERRAAQLRSAERERSPMICHGSRSMVMKHPPTWVGLCDLHLRLLALDIAGGTSDLAPTWFLGHCVFLALADCGLRGWQ